MKDHSENTDIEVVAIDLAKKSFQLHGVDEDGHKEMGKKLTRQKLKNLEDGTRPLAHCR